ncbi:Gfo/Idh/MocA family protein [Arthrobacter oryzae]|uniref:1,5-anhydro-D-fructose reductase (1,5-anhydro-D-mannitol-forming) n=1 Tax=Arthrobacter oryzae TaxID=409290 RepID=A0A495EA12_9MICC|nr:Gfo/Idh/MocA family oxidoreductase [Arthrobacter oryzae]RKR13760.1 1,5-anhydro-D-fructose reductase (1,5-anhydro-D-mannitol-forming) [Arthrobacter oryzae]
MPALKWGLIGASDIAATRVIAAIRASGGDVVGVVSGSPERAGDFAASHGLARFTTDLDELLGWDIDAVYISSANVWHYDQAMGALGAGKHVLCEKPLALEAAQAEEMVKLAEETGLILAANHHLPGSPLHAKTRELVAAGTIGTVLSAKIAHAVLLPERLRGWRLGQGTPGSGVILDITCHDASVLNPLLGTPVAVTALAVRQAEWNTGGQEDAAMTVIRYENNSQAPVLAQTHDSFTVGYAGTSLEVHGTDGTIQVIDAMTQDTQGQLVLTTGSGVRSVDVDCSEDLYVIGLRAFTAAVDGTGVPTATGRDGLMALKVALAAQESATSGRTVHIN